MNSARANKIPELKGRRDLTTMQVAKQFSSGQSSKEIAAPRPQFIGVAHNDSKGPVIASAAKQSPAQLHEIAAPRYVGARNDKWETYEIATPRHVGGAGNDKGAWWWINQAATRSWRRDVHLQVSSLVLGHEIATPRINREGRDSFTPRTSQGVDGADEQYNYLCPRSILHREGAGRSWAIRNTSNTHEVD